ncbi:hypothetical protein CBR_g18639 [Chara braunii]|uniref:Uncharacterized protein n=1 Tax=Chara braunii TaxID=69332 RepID=A0A388JTB4_CHABU|nr:hypothetical protein CBR_g18639 [Chara braunii]|eukprot:GBG61046.1 hypothetical protein CBR_g18639 [Chara braunii]
MGMTTRDAEAGAESARIESGMDDRRPGIGVSAGGEALSPRLLSLSSAVAMPPPPPHRPPSVSVSSVSSSRSSSIDPRNARFPYCIVWTPLPIIAWFIPFIGHLGICESNGVILDFAGPYFVSKDRFAFGRTARYVRLDPDLVSVRTGGLPWNEAIQDGVLEFQDRMYNLFTCNCHSFVATCLNRMAYRGSVRWNIVDLVFLVVFKGRWVNAGAVLKTLLPWFVLMAIGLYFGRWMFLVAWVGFSAALLGWFLCGTYLCRGLIVPSP